MFGIPSEFLLGTATTVISWLLERDSRKLDSDERRHELAVKRLELETKVQDVAAKRTPNWVRVALALLIIGPVMYGLVKYAGDSNVPIEYLYEVPQKSILGIFKWGKTIKVEELQGFPIMPFITHAIAQVMGFMFGRTLARRN